MPLKYLAHYPQHLQAQILIMHTNNTLGQYINQKYPNTHSIQSDNALYQYINELKQQHLRTAPPLNKVLYDNKIHVVRNALGSHTAISRVQGNRLVAKKEIRIASIFKTVAPEFLEMIAVHELAHIKESEHNKAFYKLCTHMLPNYYQLEFDLRILLTHRDGQAN